MSLLYIRSIKNIPIFWPIRSINISGEIDQKENLHGISSSVNIRWIFFWKGSKKSIFHLFKSSSKTMIMRILIVNRKLIFSRNSISKIMKKSLIVFRRSEERPFKINHISKIYSNLLHKKQSVLITSVWKYQNKLMENTKSMFDSSKNCSRKSLPVERRKCVKRS